MIGRRGFIAGLLGLVALRKVAIAPSAPPVDVQLREDLLDYAVSQRLTDAARYRAGPITPLPSVQWRKLNERDGPEMLRLARIMASYGEVTS